MNDLRALKDIPKLKQLSIEKCKQLNDFQVVRELRCHFSEKKAMALLYRLEKCTGELAALTQQVMELSREFRQKLSEKEEKS